MKTETSAGDDDRSSQEVSAETTQTAVGSEKEMSPNVVTVTSTSVSDKASPSVSAITSTSVGDDNTSLGVSVTSRASVGNDKTSQEVSAGTKTSVGDDKASHRVAAVTSSAGVGTVSSASSLTTVTVTLPMLLGGHETLHFTLSAAEGSATVPNDPCSQQATLHGDRTTASAADGVVGGSVLAAEQTKADLSSSAATVEVKREERASLLSVNSNVTVTEVTSRDKLPDDNTKNIQSAATSESRDTEDGQSEVETRSHDADWHAEGSELACEAEVKANEDASSVDMESSSAERQHDNEMCDDDADDSQSVTTMTQSREDGQPIELRDNSDREPVRQDSQSAAVAESCDTEDSQSEARTPSRDTEDSGLACDSEAKAKVSAEGAASSLKEDQPTERQLITLPAALLAHVNPSLPIRLTLASHAACRITVPPACIHRTAAGGLRLQLPADTLPHDYVGGLLACTLGRRSQVISLSLTAVH